MSGLSGILECGGKAGRNCGNYQDLRIPKSHIKGGEAAQSRAIKKRGGVKDGQNLAVTCHRCTVLKPIDPADLI